MSENAPVRWTQATVYADMWVDPDQDPRGNVAPDGELPTLLYYLGHYRLTLGMKCEGLDADQLARRSVPPSTLSLLGLVRHMARVEQSWGSRVLGGEPVQPVFSGDGEDPEFDGAIPDRTVVTEAFARWEEQMAGTDAAIARFDDLGERVPLPRHGGQQVAVRDVLVHLIEEYARHCGHADLLRECIDGRVGQ
ncbi:DinB family protein [Pseudactinotalea sp. Z1732]|uniref:DinB family protein n=1 Tax=Micrococcales TaxID=85006 RepID=UPI003C7DD9AD